MIDCGIIRPSSSPYSARILFAKKKEGDLRFCIDYRKLNQVTVKNRTPLPRTRKLFDLLSKAKIFSVIDLQRGYHQFRLRDEDIPKTAFMTKYGNYEFVGVPMGLSNSPTLFVAGMNEIFIDM